MNYSELKIIIEGVRKGITNDDKLTPLVNQAMKMVARKAKPLVLVSNDIADEILTHIDQSESLGQVFGEEYFIRVPSEIKNDDDILDIDSDLNMAVAYQTIILFTGKTADYQTLLDGVITDYQWMKYKTVEEMKNE